jgi:hypothetical protein
MFHVLKVPDKELVATAGIDALAFIRVSQFGIQVRSIQKFFTHRPVSTFDRVSFQLTDELFLYGTTLSCSSP